MVAGTRRSWSAVGAVNRSSSCCATLDRLGSCWRPRCRSAVRSPALDGPWSAGQFDRAAVAQHRAIRKSSSLITGTESWFEPARQDCKDEVKYVVLIY
ncbi:hypothetical protein ACFQZE_23905 [Paenibacillus sp. GCM10027627]